MRTREFYNSNGFVRWTFEHGGTDLTVEIPDHVIGRSNAHFIVDEDGPFHEHTVQWIGLRRPEMEVTVTSSGANFGSVSVPSQTWERVKGDSNWGTGNWPTRGKLPTQEEYYADLLDAVASLVRCNQRADAKDEVIYLDTGYESKVFSDVVVPNFYARRNAGEVFVNPMSKQHVTCVLNIEDQHFPAEKVYAYPSGYPGTAPSQWGSSYGLSEWAGMNIPNGGVISPSSGITAGLSMVPNALNHYGQRSYPGTDGSVASQSAYSEDVRAVLEGLFQPASILSNPLFNKLQYLDTNAASLEAVYSSINDSEAELLTELVESRETVGLLWSTILRFTNFIRLLKKPSGLRQYARRTWKRAKRQLSKNGNKPSSAAIARFIFEHKWSDAWLEARYGWRPIVYSIQQAAAGFDLSRPPRKTFREKRSDSDSFTENDEVFLNGTRVSRSGALCKAEDVSALNLLGLYNLGTTALELIPFSFIVGWVVNLSAVAAEFNPSPIYSALGSWTVQQTDTSFVFPVVSPGDIPLLQDIVTRPIVVSGTVIDVVRMPNPERSFFSFDLNLDGYKFADLAAILRKLAS